MDVRAAAKLIAPAVPRARAAWADLGAGNGTFTNALATLLEPGSRVYAVDRDTKAVESLERLRRLAPNGVEIHPIQGDFTTPLDLAGLDGIVVANALHYVPYDEQSAIMWRVLGYTVPGARLLVVDYDGRGPNRWVPYPVSVAHLTTLAHDLGLGAPHVVGTRPSAYGGTMYAAVLETTLHRGDTGPVEGERPSR